MNTVWFSSENISNKIEAWTLISVKSKNTIPYVWRWAENYGQKLRQMRHQFWLLSSWGTLHINYSTSNCDMHGQKKTAKIWKLVLPHLENFLTRFPKMTPTPSKYLLELYILWKKWYFERALHIPYPLHLWMLLLIKSYIFEVQFVT